MATAAEQGGLGGGAGDDYRGAAVHLFGKCGIGRRDNSVAWKKRPTRGRIKAASQGRAREMRRLEIEAWQVQAQCQRWGDDGISA